MSTVPMTLEQVTQALPAHLRKSVPQSLVDELNNLQLDSEHAQVVRENFLSYTKVLTEGRFKPEDYLNAVKYVSFKLMGYNNQEAYTRTFPQRHAQLLAKGATPQEVSAYVSMYAKGKLVNLILEQTLVPSWVLNQDLYQKSLNVLASEMHSAPSAMVRVTAATNLANLLKKPEAAGPLINLDMRENSGVKELRELLSDLAQKQVSAIQAGTPTKEIAAQVIIEKPEKPE